MLLKWNISEYLAGVHILTLERVDGLPHTFRRTGVAFGYERDQLDHNGHPKPFGTVFPRWNVVEKQQVTLI
jgi:hypothetical protein